MKYNIKVSKNTIQVLGNRSIRDFLEDEGIDCEETKTLNNKFLTIINFGEFDRRDKIKKIKSILERIGGVE